MEVLSHLGQNHNHELSPHITNQKVIQLLNQPLISRDEANYLLEHSNLPLFIDGGKLYMEDDDREWIIG